MISVTVVNYLLGLVVGCFLESIYRSYNAKKFVRPLLINAQMYALAAVFIYLIYLLEVNFLFKMLLLLVITTGIEYLLGFLYLKIKKVRLWDYRGESFNYQGIIRLRFSIYWLGLSLVYYSVLHLISILY